MLFMKWTNPGINKRLYEILAILKGIINPFSNIRLTHPQNV